MLGSGEEGCDVDVFGSGSLRPMMRGRRMGKRRDAPGVQRRGEEDEFYQVWSVLRRMLTL